MSVELFVRGGRDFLCRIFHFLILTATAAGLTLPLQTASAQTAGTMEEIVSLGTRSVRERTAVDSAVPVDVFSGEDLRTGNLTETSRMLQFAAPSFNFSTSTISDGTDIVRPSTLRGMNPDQTLVLVNGKRRHNTALMHVNGSIGRGTAGVDLNAIPPSSIERIEVLRDGASAQYGSDAIAGVINIVLKDQSETIDPFVHYGSTYNGDGDTVQAAVNAGFPLLDEGFINLTVEYRDRENTNHSGRDPRQIFNFTEQVNGSPQLSTGTLPPEEATFDRRNHRYGDPDSENWYFSWNSAIPVGDLELYSFGGIARREGESGGFYRREYDGRTIPSIHPGGFLPLINTDVDDDSIGVGIEGEMGSFDFDASVVYGENEFDFFISNSNNVTLGPTSPTSADAGGLVFDQLTFNLDFVTTIDLLGLEDVSTAFGVEYRQDGYEIRAGEFASWANGPLDDDDPTTTADAAAAFPNQYGGTGAPGIQVFPGFRPSNSLDEDRDSWALYTDFEADISDDWLVGFALRFEDYDDFGSTLNGKLASRYNISDSLALRGAVSTGFRAPSLHQQFFNNTSTQFVTVGGVPNVPTEVGTLRNDDPVVRNGFGIPELDEETSVNLSAGFA